MAWARQNSSGDQPRRAEHGLAAASLQPPSPTPRSLAAANASRRRSRIRLGSNSATLAIILSTIRQALVVGGGIDVGEVVEPKTPSRLAGHAQPQAPRRLGPRLQARILRVGTPSAWLGRTPTAQRLCSTSTAPELRRGVTAMAEVTRAPLSALSNHLLIDGRVGEHVAEGNDRWSLFDLPEQLRIAPRALGQRFAEKGICGGEAMNRWGLSTRGGCLKG